MIDPEHVKKRLLITREAIEGFSGKRAGDLARAVDMICELVEEELFREGNNG